MPENNTELDHILHKVLLYEHHAIIPLFIIAFWRIKLGCKKGGTQKGGQGRYISYMQNNVEFDDFW